MTGHWLGDLALAVLIAAAVVALGYGLAWLIVRMVP